MTAKLYKVGDKVRIKTKDELLSSGWEFNESHNMYEHHNSSLTVVENMFGYLGKEIVIDRLDSDSDNYIMKLYDIGVPFEWKDSMIAGLVEDPKEEASTVDSKLEPRPGNKYHRTIHDVNFPQQTCVVDVYEVIEAFSVACPARQHAIKKILCSGIRGKGDLIQDLTEAKDAIQRAIEMERNRK